MRKEKIKKRKRTTRGEESSYIQKKDRSRWRLTQKSHIKFTQDEGCLGAEKGHLFVVFSFIQKPAWMDDYMKEKKNEVF